MVKNTDIPVPVLPVWLFLPWGGGEEGGNEINWWRGGGGDHVMFMFEIEKSFKKSGMKKNKNHGTQDSRVVPHRGTNWAALWLTSQIGRDAVLSESYGRGYIWSH
jgi:hypothetical protein